MKGNKHKISCKQSAKKETAQRNTLPKAIAAAFKSGKKHGALDLAVYGRKMTVLVNLARDLYWLCRVQQPDIKQMAMSSGGERHGWEPPRRQSAKERAQRLERWTERKRLELETRLTILAKRDPRWLKKLEREFERVGKEDAEAILFNPPSNKKSAANNPNWFRQILIANLGLVETKVWDKQSVNLISRQPYPLNKVAKEIRMDVSHVRREVRKLGIKPGNAGRPKRQVTLPYLA